MMSRFISIFQRVNEIDVRGDPIYCCAVSVVDSDADKWLRAVAGLTALPEGDVSAFTPSMAGADGSRQGVVVLGVPIGFDEFVLQTVGRRMWKLGVVVPLLRILRDP
jgi:hypothetical protein